MDGWTDARKDGESHENIKRRRRKMSEGVAGCCR
jgi:hypothetical protein